MTDNGYQTNLLKFYRAAADGWSFYCRHPIVDHRRRSRSRITPEAHCGVPMPGCVLFFFIHIYFCLLQRVLVAGPNGQREPRCKWAIGSWRAKTRAGSLFDHAPGRRAWGCGAIAPPNHISATRKHASNKVPCRPARHVRVKDLIRPPQLIPNRAWTSSSA